MKKLLTILLILFALIGNSQVLVYPANYTLGNYCFQGDGANNYIEDNNGLDVYSFIQNTNIFTISVWIKIDNLANRQTIASNSISTIGKGFFLSWETAGGGYGDEAIRLSMTKGAGGPVVDCHSDNGATITDNNWHHILVTSNAAGDNIKFYVDKGLLTTTYKKNFTVLSTGNCTDNLFIGVANNSGALILHFSGSMHNIAIKDYSVNQAGVDSLYDFNYNASNVSLFPCVNGFNDTVYDVSGNNHHSVIHGADYWNTDNTNTYCEDYGMTYVKYGSQKVLVPYLLNGNSQYSAVAPVINAGEVTREFPATWWDSEKIVTNNNKVVK